MSGDENRGATSCGCYVPVRGPDHSGRAAPSRRKTRGGPGQWRPPVLKADDEPSRD